MTRSLIAMLVALGLTGGAEPAGPVADAPAVFMVNMVDKSPTSFAFEPSHIEVKPGDVVRFRQTGVMPHNVEFRDPPAGAELGDIRVGPFVIAKGEIYEITIDERFVAGAYPFVCTPHATMGMTGTLVVEGEGTL